VDLMAGANPFAELREAVAAAPAVSAVGGRTHWEVGGPPPEHAVEVSVPAEVVTFDPDDLTVTVQAGIACGELAAVLAEHGQECALDPRDPRATVGGVLAAGLSGHRRLRWGPLRDRVLEVRFVTADGRLVKGGGPTVKNVSGFDVPRLLVGSLGTLGVIAQVTMRCQPLPAASAWCTTTLDPFAVRAAVLRPACIRFDGTTTHVLLEGETADVAAELASISGTESDMPAWPEASHRGRISVPPAELRPLLDGLGGSAGLPATGVAFAAEMGVGTVHVAAPTADALVAARETAERLGGWLLREQGAPDVDGFGVALPNVALMRRIAEAFDPTGKCAPGRLPLATEATRREQVDVR
jgi:glycolate oxidase FAD binding subunit